MEGIAVHAYNVLKLITSSHPEHQFLFLFDRPYNEEFIFSTNITPVILAPQARHPLLYYIWFEYSLERVLSKIKPDIFYSPDGFLCLKSDVCSIPVIHDLNYEHYPDDLPILTSWYYRKYFPQFARKAQRVLTVSEYSKMDISKTYSISPSKIDVVYNGPDKSYRVLTKTEKEVVKQKYSYGNEYFLHVSALHPRKNVLRLLQAFEQVKNASSSPIKLLLVGPHYFKNSKMNDYLRTMNFKNDVIFTGRLPVSELSKVAGAAFALTYISYFEGFGIPLVEAMNCEIPILTSNATSMPEVAGDVALYVDPFSVDSIAQGMLELLNNPSIRQRLVEKGRIRKNFFSWEKTAALTWKSIEKSFEECRSSHF